MINISKHFQTLKRFLSGKLQIIIVLGGVILFIIAILLIFIGQHDYRQLGLKSIDYPVGKFSLASSDSINIQNLKIYLSHVKSKNRERLYVYLDIDVIGQFEYLSVDLPWKVNSSSLVNNLKYGEESYSIDSTGHIVIYGTTGKQEFHHSFFIDVKPAFECRFSETTFTFPIFYGFSVGMPYSSSKELLRKIIVPKISYMEVIFSSNTLKSINYSLPLPDAMINMDNANEIRWWFNPDKSKYPGSINVSFIDKELKDKENAIAFNSGIYLSIGFTILLSLVFEIIKLSKKRRD